MLYFVRGLENGNMKLHQSDLTDFETIIQVRPTIISTEAKFKVVTTRNGAETTKAKLDLCYYFISGEMSGRWKSKNNILSRRLLVLDFDNKEGLPIEQIKQAVHEGLGEFSYYLYPSTSYTEEHPKIRLIVDSEGDMNEAEYKQTITDLSSLINLPLDSSSEGFAQIQGLPCTDDLELFNQVKVINHGKQFPVSEVPDVPAQEQKFNFKSNYVSSEGYKGKVVQLLEEAIQGIQEGNRNTFFTRAFGTLITANMEAELAMILLLEWNRTYCQPPLSETEMISIFNSIYEREKRKVKNA